MGAEVLKAEREAVRPALASTAAPQATARPSAAAVVSPQSLMGNGVLRQRAGASAGEGPGRDLLALQGAAGNRAVQRWARGGSASSPAGVHRAAQAGVAGPGGRLPHYQAIQRSFGPAHDLSGVQAHVGGSAAAANAAMHATAFTTGEHVAFKASPDLWLAAHEAAHVVQQRGGVSLAGGVGRAGDSYERQADTVADRVVSGRPAHNLLAGTRGAGRSAVQRCGGVVHEGCDCAKEAGEPKKVEETATETSVAVQRNGDGGLLGEVESGLSSAVSTVTSAAGEVAAGVESAASTVAAGVESAATTVAAGVESAASSAVDAVSGAASALGNAVSDEVQAARQALGAYLEGKTAEAVALIARLQSQLGTLATMIIPADKLAELNGHIASVNSLGKGLVSLPSIGGAAGSEAGESSASPGAVSGLLASLQSAMQSLSSSSSSSSSSSAKSPPVQRLVSGAALAAFEAAEEAATVTSEAETIPAAVLAPETGGISILVALGIAAAIAVVAGLIGYAVYRYTHPEKRPWGPEDEATYSRLQQLEPTIAGRPGVDYRVKPADVLADPAKSAKWDECVALHEKYEPTKELYVDAAKDIDVIKAKIKAGTATSDDYNKFCELLRARIKLAEQLATERFDYVALDCDDLPWPVLPGETPKTPAEARKGHITQFEENLNSMKNLLEELAKTWC